VEFRIADPAGIGCHTPFEPDYYEPIRIGCEAYDCGWTGLNDLAELIGQSGGRAVRYLTTRQMVESLGQLVGENGLLRAINNYGRVIGIVDQGEGKIDSFVYGELDPDGFAAPELSWVPGVALYGLNDAGVAVGGRFDGNRMVAVRWVKGKVEELQVPSVNAVALTINSAGNIAGMHIGKGDLQDRGFVIDDQGFHDFGDLGGKIITLAMNDAGVVAGTILSEQSVRGFVYSAETGLSDLKSFTGSSQAVVSGINAAGLVVGTVRGEKDGDRRGFRFMDDRGGEDLNQFVKADRMVIVEEAIAVNNSGQILAFGSEKGEPGYFLLNPVSIPQPQLPIP